MYTPPLTQPNTPSDLPSTPSSHRYWMKAWRGAMMFQRAWDRFWSIAKLRRHRAARRVQTGW